jgi:hypothetical protein
LAVGRSTAFCIFTQRGEVGSLHLSSSSSMPISSKKDLFVDNVAVESTLLSVLLEDDILIITFVGMLLSVAVFEKCAVDKLMIATDWEESGNKVGREGFRCKSSLLPFRRSEAVLLYGTFLFYKNASFEFLT